MRIRLSGWRGRREVVAFIRWLEGVIDLRHPVVVVRTGRIHGYFDAPRLNTFGPWMLIADDEHVLRTIAHEFAHYEQWRDKRTVNEKGVEQRACALVKRWKREVR